MSDVRCPAFYVQGSGFIGFVGFIGLIAFMALIALIAFIGFVAFVGFVIKLIKPKDHVCVLNSLISTSFYFRKDFFYRWPFSTNN
ncbi:hypothetical protein BMS3Abin07_00011 [bacterium BMS3Abin07]|nr:hypothetical protein BMS3Abin07_00011 [bacterium BMS3Abin07]